jgi:hypothetical protein
MFKTPPFAPSFAATGFTLAAGARAQTRLLLLLPTGCLA